jgi:large conductance mechanosensitive channel
MLKEFRTFITRGNVVDLAVGIVIGVAFGAVVNSFVDNIINPLIGLAGDRDFSQFTLTLRDDVELRYGAVVTVFITFLLTAAALFFLVVKPINALNERRLRRSAVEQEEPAELSDEARLLSEIRDLLREQQASTRVT